MKDVARNSSVYRMTSPERRITEACRSQSSLMPRQRTENLLDGWLALSMKPGGPCCSSVAAPVLSTNNNRSKRHFRDISYLLSGKCDTCAKSSTFPENPRRQLIFIMLPPLFVGKKTEAQGGSHFPEVKLAKICFYHL